MRSRDGKLRNRTIALYFMHITSRYYKYTMEEIILLIKKEKTHIIVKYLNVI